MKRITITPYQAGLVFENGVYKRMLPEGKHWLWPWENVRVYDTTVQFETAYEPNILLQDKELADRLHIIEVKEDEIVLQYESGLLKQVLARGRYLFWKGVMQYRFVRAGLSKVQITEDIDRATLQHRLVAPYVRTFNVEAYEKAVLFIDGKYAQTLAGGVYSFWRNSIPIVIGKTDTRQQQLELNGQEILTKDKAALRINAWAQYKVANIEKALLQHREYDKQLYILFQLALRGYVAGLGLDELLEKKEALAPFILQAVSDKAADLGVTVTGFGIRDIILPGDMKEIMNQVLVAEKKAQANGIMRREETASTRSLLNTARLMEDNSMLWKLKEMEYVEKIAEKISNISINGNGALVDQLRQIFTTQK